MSPVRATYRVQFSRDFTFAGAERIVPYLADLGISHLYASPITTAQPGSTHGYDVIDPTKVNPELGGEEGLRRLVAALKAHGLGLIIDIVPNHAGVAGDTNAWWQDVLARGEASPYARFFDIEWAEALLLPFLGEPLRETIAKGHLKLQERNGRVVAVAYGSTSYPIRDEHQGEVRAAGLDTFTGDRLSALLDRQHYRLAWWRTANDDLRWRRFFTISELAGLRIEDDEVFEAVHALYFRLYEEGLIDGVRVDHVDGLTDPAAYLRKLRERLGPQAYIVVEKILAGDESLDRAWPVDGTTGYDFMEEVSALLHAPQGETPLSRFWTELTGRPADFAAEELQARRDMLSWEFEGQLAACVRAFAALAASAPETEALTPGMIRRAIERLLWFFPVYRAYGTGSSAPPGDAAIRARVRECALPLAPPGETGVLDSVLAWLAGAGTGEPALAADAVRRFQQLSAPIAAKAVEDTAFYRYGRLLSRNDVGFDPARFSMPVEQFHRRMGERAEHWPRAMLATATHDHKRGEDVRARLAVLSETPEEWTQLAARWAGAVCAGPLAPDDVYQLLQMLVGAWPADPDVSDPGALRRFRDRVAAWQEKALREAKLRSSWADPDGEYEAHARALLDRILDPQASPGFLGELTAFVRRIAPAAEANSLVQTFLRCTAPGVPDLYQGCEYADLSLVDPDNRRPVDFAARRATLPSIQLLEGGQDTRKQALIATLLRLRRDEPDLFAGASWEPIAVEGERAGHVLAFLRRCGNKALLAAAAIRCAPALVGTDQLVPHASWWGNTRLVLPEDVPGWAARDIIPAGPGPFSRLPLRLALLSAP
jgi:(1->4)-alpha-D-glucan 1-alpha-D-glucosylmutase